LNSNARTYYLYGAVLLVSIVYVIRLLQIQVLDDKYSAIAEKISLRKQTLYPQRGLILDRNEKLIVFNEPVYDLMLSVPIKLNGIDTLAFCQLIGITKDEFDAHLVKARRTAYRGKAIFRSTARRIL
jgi:penicillin-binding protein 2